jgi:hypothetical protein
VISPLAQAHVNALAYDRASRLLYAGTRWGISAISLPELFAGARPLQSVILYPNPVRVDLGDRSLRIGRIDEPVRVEIFDMEGNRVHQREAAESDEEVWDLTTSEGFLAASGIYLVRITGSKGTVLRRIAVVR